jgi:hypothetical protein
VALLVGGGDVGIVVVDFCAEVLQLFDELEAGAFADVVYVRFIGEAEDENLCAFDGFASVVEG